VIRSVLGKEPRIAKGAFVAENATVIGEVELADEASVWYGAVLRGDVGYIKVGPRSNVQDLACIHMTGGLSQTEIGSDVTVGHSAIIHGAKIGNGVLVGMGSILLDGAEIGDECVIAAGSVVPPRMRVPARSLVRGAPAKIVREVTEDERLLGKRGAEVYVELARAHAASR
jgi:carbonic anhydrase/acetyltransferase-like protein (isoleucine patch superfamily)